MKDTIIDLEKEFDIEYKKNILDSNSFGSFTPEKIFKESFINIYDSELIKSQFKKEFLKAPKDKNYRLYINQYYTPEQINAIIIESNSKIPTVINTDKPIMASFVETSEGEKELMKLQNDFHLLKKPYDERYNLNDIKQTKIYNTLQKIEEKFSAFKKNLKEPKIIANAIRIILIENNIDDSLQLEILTALLNKNQNGLLSIYKKSIDEWNLAKDIFNKEIFKYRNKIKEANKISIKDEPKLEIISFSKKLEDFFIQTNYCLVLNPEPVLKTEKGLISLMLPPEQFYKISNEFQIEYPFLIDVKIQELKSLMIKEKIAKTDAIAIFNSLEKHYNPIDSVIMFQPVLDKLNNFLKYDNPFIKENDILKEQINFNNYLEGIKKEYHSKLYESLFGLESLRIENELILNNELKINDTINLDNSSTVQITTKESEIRLKVKEHFNFYREQCPRKHKQILNDEDFDKLINWTVFYFENSFKIPEIDTPIKIVNTNKTFVQLSFKYLFKELHTSKYPESLFEFYRLAFKKYEDDKRSNFEAVPNNDEVKKLMNIDF